MILLRAQKEELVDLGQWVINCLIVLNNNPRSVKSIRYKSEINKLMCGKIKIMRKNGS